MTDLKFLDLEPLRHTRTDLSIAKEVLAVIQLIVVCRRLWKRKHSLPIPPVDENTKGVKVPCSMSSVLREYKRRFLFS